MNVCNKVENIQRDAYRIAMHERKRKREAGHRQNLPSTHGARTDRHTSIVRLYTAGKMQHLLRTRFAGPKSTSATYLVISERKNEPTDGTNSLSHPVNPEAPTTRISMSRLAIPAFGCVCAFSKDGRRRSGWAERHMWEVRRKEQEAVGI